jgi:hypothetical protein
VRRWLHYSEDEWDALSWDRRQAYLDGLSAEEDIPFRIEPDPFQVPERQAAAGGDGPVTRRVDAGPAVIDLAAMKRELEANPAARRRS